MRRLACPSRCSRQALKAGDLLALARASVTVMIEPSPAEAAVFARREFVDADDNVTRFDAAHLPALATELLFHIAALHRDRRAAPSRRSSRVPPARRPSTRRPSFHDGFRPSGSSNSSRSVSYASTCCMQRPLLIPRPRQARRFIQTGNCTAQARASFERHRQHFKRMR